MKYVLTFEASTMVELRSGCADFATLNLGAGVVTGLATLPGAAVADDDSGPVNAVAPGTVDKDGLPWNETIHAATKGLNADGTWRKRRGVAADVVAAIEAQLRSIAANPPAALPAAVAPVALIPLASLPPVAVASLPPTVAPVALAPVSLPPVVAPVSNGQDFPALMQYVSTGMQSGLIQNEYLLQLYQRLGVADLSALANDPQKTAVAIATLHNEGRIAA